MKNKKIALLIDFDNIAIGLQEYYHIEFKAKLVLDELAKHGDVLLKVAYGDWGFNSKGGDALMHLGFEQRQLTHFKKTANGNGRGKNGGDIQMTIDMMDILYENKAIDTFVIVSGDADFVPIIHRLKRAGREVIIVTLDEVSSKLLNPNCSVISYNVLADFNGIKNDDHAETKGKINFMHPSSFYGFIEDTNPEDKKIFFHGSDVVVPGFQQLRENDFVTFEMETTDRGLVARKIRKT